MWQPFQHFKITLCGWQLHPSPTLSEISGGLVCEYELDLYANFGHKQRVGNKGPHAGLALPDPTTNNLPSKQPKHSCSQAKRCTRFWTTCMRRSPQPASGLFTISSPNTFSQKRTFALTVAKPGLGTKLEESQSAHLATG